MGRCNKKLPYTDGLKVELEVSGGVISGSGEAEAEFAATDNGYGNYIIKASSAKISFEVEEKTTGNYVSSLILPNFILGKNSMLSIIAIQVIPQIINESIICASMLSKRF